MKRTYRRGYYRVQNISESGKAILWGAEIYHSYNCGRFTKDGEKYYLFFCIFVRESLPDTQGRNQESIDTDMTTTDRLSKHTLWKKMCAKENVKPHMLESVEPPLTPSVKAEILAIQGADESDLGVFRRGMHCMVEEFMGFTFKQVRAKQPVRLIKYTDEEGNVFRRPNIWKNSQERR